MAERQQCRSCGKAIYWLKNVKTGSLAPINADPSPNGNIDVDLDAGAYAIVPRDLYMQDDRPRHLNHFADCPNAAKHHKAKK